jgi:hypothetical protein
MWTIYYLSMKEGSLFAGENPLRCTTHDEKGLILTTIFFNLIF